MFDELKNKNEQRFLTDHPKNVSSKKIREQNKELYDVLEQEFKNFSMGIVGVVKTTDSLAQLNALPDGIYEAATEGTYANGLVAKKGYWTKFEKKGTKWEKIEVEMPSVSISGKIEVGQTTEGINGDTAIKYIQNKAIVPYDSAFASSVGYANRAIVYSSNGKTYQSTKDNNKDALTSASWTEIILNIPTGEVKKSEKRAVSGGEVYDKTMTKQVYLDTEVTRSVNMFNPNDVLLDKWFTNPTETSASKIQDWNGRYMSGYIPVEEGKTYIAFGMASSTNRRILGFTEKGKTTADWFFNAYSSSPTGVFTIPTGLGVKYVVVAISTSYPSFINTAMIAEGDQVIPYEPYYEPIVKENIKPKYLEDYYTKEEVDDIIKNIEIDVEGVDLIDLEKSNFITKQNLRESDKKTSNDLDLNSKTKIGGVKQVRRIANPMNKDIKNALIPLYVHSGNNEGDVHERHFYLENNGEINSVRFKANGEVLNQSKLSEIPYEFVVDSRITGATMCDDEGNLIFQDEENIKLSSDNLETSRLIKAGFLAGINKIGDIFYQTNRNDGVLKKSTKSSNYTDESEVLNVGFSSSFYTSSFKLTDDGTIFVGNYQESPFNAKIWKSSNNGDTFSLSLDQASRQHVHSIVIDRSTTPNTVFVNIDGNISGDSTKMMALYKTTNLGESWTQVSNPFPTDYGVLYAKNGTAIGGGEGSVKGSPTIYRRDISTNNIDIVVDNFQNTQKAYRINDAVIIAGGGHSQNGTPILYFSEDMYLTSKIIYIDRHINSSVMNRSYRGGTNEESITPKGNSNKQHFVYSSYKFGVVEPFRLIDNGNSQALFLVHVPFFPKEGIDIEFGSNYVGQGTENNVFQNKIGNVLNIEATEKGEYLFDDNLKEYKKEETSEFDESISKRFGSIFPRKYPLMNKGGISGTEININDTSLSGKTVEMFYKVGTYGYASVPRYILRGSGLDVNRNGEKHLFVNSQRISDVFLRNSDREYAHICFVFSSNKVTLYHNGYTQGEVSIDTSSMVLSKVGEFNNNISDRKQDSWSNFKIHDFEFTQEDVWEAYYGGVIV